MDDNGAIDSMHESIEFEIKQVYAQMAFDTDMALKNSNIKVFADYCGRTLASVMYKVLTKEECIAEYPADWWQAFKERFFPAWAKRRWPVKTTVIVAVHKFPHFGLGKEYVHTYVRVPRLTIKEIDPFGAGARKEVL